MNKYELLREILHLQISDSLLDKAKHHLYRRQLAKLLNPLRLNSLIDTIDLDNNTYTITFTQTEMIIELFTV